MPAKEIKELRVAGKLEEAYEMAISELNLANSKNENLLWAKRNLSWVLYSQLDKFYVDPDKFLEKLSELKSLDLPASEEMFYDNLSIVTGKAARAIGKHDNFECDLFRLFAAVKELPFKKPSKWYSFMYKSFHKYMKETGRYTEFAEWWDFQNFMKEDYLKESLPGGKAVMSLAEQAYIAYSKHLLPKRNQAGEMIFNKDKAITFLPELDKIIESYPDYQYPAYFRSKLLLALGEKEKMLSSLLPFAKKKKNDFWVWELLAEAFIEDQDKVFACYCRALSCNGQEEMVVSLRQKVASILIKRELYNEAKTEIELLYRLRSSKGFKIPEEVSYWQDSEWYKKAQKKTSNNDFYKKYINIADDLLFSDQPEETVIVEFVNTDRRILNFVASEESYGFFKYDRFLTDVKIGDVLKVRFRNKNKGGIHQVDTMLLAEDEAFRNQFLAEVEGEVRILEGRNFGFINDIYIHPSLVTKNKLGNGSHLKGIAMKSYNAEKKQWSWKLISIKSEK